MLSDFTSVLAVFAVVVSLFALRKTRRLARRVSELEALRSQVTIPDLSETPDTPSDDETTPEEAQASDRSGWGGGGRRTSPALAGLGAWVRTNWIYPVAGAALVMAAVFLVQYSIERGFLSPTTRIWLSVSLGAALIGAGEFIRRRWGDEGSSARMLPSTLSGAGIVTLFAGILAAFHLYDLLSTTTTLVLLAAVAVLAMGLGWAHGPLLAAIGVVAGAASPFLINAGGVPNDLLYVYFALIGVIGLGIDGFKRWEWVSMLAVLASMMGGTLIKLAGAQSPGYVMLLVLVALLAMALPAGAIVPRSVGTRITQWRQARPSGATVVSAVATALACALLVFLREPVWSLLALGALALLHPVWTRAAPALADQAIFLIISGPAAILVTGYVGHTDLSSVMSQFPWLPFTVLALSVLSSVLMLKKSQRDDDTVTGYWSVLAVGYPGAIIVAFELFWSISSYYDTWAFTAMALAVGYVATALWAAKGNAGQGVLMGASAAAAFAMIAFALTLLLSFSALTVALAVLMLAAAVIDRRFDIALLGWFQALGSMALGWRILINPGLSWLMGWEGTGRARDFDVVLSLSAAIIGPAMAIILSRGLAKTKIRDWSGVIVETGLMGIIPISVSIFIARFIGETISLHAHFGIQATVFIALCWVQAQRAERLADSRALKVLRRVLVFVFGVGAALLGIGATFLFSPLANSGLRADPVIGMILLNDLILAYAIPGALLVWLTRAKTSRGAMIARMIGFGLLAYWIGCVIRHIWQGGGGMSLGNGFAQGELYAYTVALLISGAFSMALALRMGQTALRLAGLALIAIAAAKAFLIDASGLTGLMRVGAFLGLGLSLAGLAWLNAWVSARMAQQQNAK